MCEFGGKGKLPGRFVRPRGVACDFRQGNIVVVDDHGAIHEERSSRSLDKIWPTRSACADNEGRILVGNIGPRVSVSVHVFVFGVNL